MRIRNSIYLDHQASTPLDGAVFDKMLPFFTESCANPHSSDHALGWSASEAIDRASSQISRLIGCDSDEVIYTSGATEANNLAVLGLRYSQETLGRNQIITTDIEHKSVLSCCHAMASYHDAHLRYLIVNSYGEVDLDFLESTISDKTLIVTIGAVNSEIGTIQNLKEIYAIATRYGAFVHLDAAQMPAATSVTGVTDYADLISLSAHKFYGPKGIGCLYIRRELQDDFSPLIYGGGQQKGLRSGTLPVPLCVGMGAAATLICNAPEIREYLRAKTERLWNGLTSLPWGVQLNGTTIAARHPGNLNVSFPGFHAEEILGALQPHLAVSTGSACTSGTVEPSYVLRAIGLTDEEARSSIRFSAGKATTEQDIDDALVQISSALTQLETAGLREVL